MRDVALGDLLRGVEDALASDEAFVRRHMTPNERGFRMPRSMDGRPWFTDAMQCDRCGALVTATTAEAQRRGEAAHRENCG